MFQTMIFRSSTWTKAFLLKALHLLSFPGRHSFKHNEWHEQSPIMYLLLIPSLIDALRCTIIDSKNVQLVGSLEARDASDAKKIEAGPEKEAPLYSNSRHQTRNCATDLTQMQRKTESDLNSTRFKGETLQDAFNLNNVEPRTLGYDSHVQIVSQKTMNSYPAEIVDAAAPLMNHWKFHDGEFVISFNGCSSLIGNSRCEDLFLTYYLDSLKKIRDLNWS